MRRRLRLEPVGDTLIEMRVNARLDPAVARKLAYLKTKRGETTSTILKRAIEAYYEKEVGSSSTPLALLEQTGFVACAPGPIDLSTNYKRALVS